MVIVIVSPYQLRLCRGIERFVYSLANQLARDFEMRIIIYVWQARNPVSWGPWHENIRIRRVPRCRYFQVVLAMVFYSFWIFFDKPGCVILNFLFHGEEFLSRKKQYLYVLHYPASQTPVRYEFIKNKSIKFPYLNFVAVSEMVKKEAFPYLKLKKTTVIYNGVDTKNFYEKSIFNPEDKTLKIITAASLEERKGIQFVIKALSLLKERSFIYSVYGEGPFKEELISLVRDNNLEGKVIFYNTTDAINNLMRNSDIFCLLSKGEACPMALLEAMSCGLPAVVSQYPPFNEIITQETGVMVIREDSFAVSEAINRLCDINERKNLGLSARKRIIDYFSLQRSSRQYRDLLSGK